MHPKLQRSNEKVERANGTEHKDISFAMLYEMSDSISGLKKLYDEYEYFYNQFRPHRALNNLSPMRFYDKIKNTMVA